MAPEIRVYIPSESVNKFAKDVKKRGGEILSSKLVPKDSQKTIDVDKLATTVRETLDRFPEDINLSEFDHVSNPQGPPLWHEMISGMTSQEKVLINKAMRRIRKQRITTLGEARGTDWQLQPLVYHEGVPTRNFIRKIFT